MTELVLRGRRRRRLLVGALLVAVIAILGMLTMLGAFRAPRTSSEREVIESESHERTLSPNMSAVLGDYVFYQAGPADSWYTAFALTVRNDSRSSLVLRQVTFDKVVALKVGQATVVGPQVPSQTLHILPGDPPRQVDPDGPLTRFHRHSISGYTIPPETPGRSSPPYGKQKYVSDEENDASIVVPILRQSSAPSGFIHGITVVYSRDGSIETAKFPDVEFGLCDREHFDAKTCQPE